MALSTLSAVKDSKALVFAHQSWAPIFARHDHGGSARPNSSSGGETGTPDRVLSARAAVGDVDGVRRPLGPLPIVKEPSEYLLGSYLKRGDLAGIESIPEGEFSVERARLGLAAGPSGGGYGYSRPPASRAARIWILLSGRTRGGGGAVARSGSTSTPAIGLRTVAAGPRPTPPRLASGWARRDSISFGTTCQKR